MEKKLFHNISGAIHNNNISEILMLFEYFRNMYPCHKRLKQKFKNGKLKVIFVVIVTYARPM